MSIKTKSTSHNSKKRQLKAALQFLQTATKENDHLVSRLAPNASALIRVELPYGFRTPALNVILDEAERITISNRQLAHLLEELGD